ncbi:MAG: hypothetical protein AAGA55_07685 [Planctomycetota bacterium]
MLIDLVKSDSAVVFFAVVRRINEEKGLLRIEPVKYILEVALDEGHIQDAAMKGMKSLVQLAGTIPEWG